MNIIKSFLRNQLASRGYVIARKESINRMDYSAIARFLYFQRMFTLARAVEGDVVECGVGYGNSLLMFSILVKEEMNRRKIWAFDSFEGFPEPAEEDESIRNPKKGEWGDSSVIGVHGMLLDNGLDTDFVTSQVTIVKGFFEDSLSKYRGDGIAILHLDVDLYESYVTTLTELYPRLASGGVLMFDEYMGTIEHVSYPGAQRAIDETLGEDKALIKRDEWTGKYYLVKP